MSEICLECYAGHSDHDHSHSMTRRTLRFAFFLTLVIAASQTIGGLLAHSLALLSDAGHVLTDLFALGLAWFAAVQAERPANARNTFGYHRVGILAALVNAITLILITIGIFYEALQRFRQPEPVNPLIMLISAWIGIVINLIIAFGLQKESHNLNTRAAALHVFGDVAASIGVIIASVIILLTGWSPIDPILSIGIAVLIAIGAWGVVCETTDILMEAVPKGLDMTALVEDMQGVVGVQTVHDLHVWSISSGMSSLSCHVTIADQKASESSSILCALESLLKEKYHIEHCTIQFECHAHQAPHCSVNGLYCQLTDISKR